MLAADKCLQAQSLYYKILSAFSTYKPIIAAVLHAYHTNLIGFICGELPGVPSSWFLYSLSPDAQRVSAAFSDGTIITARQKHTRKLCNQNTLSVRVVKLTQVWRACRK